MSTPSGSEFETGYLAGLVDGEGYIYVHYVRGSDRTYPDLRIYCTSRSIIEGACRIMGVNPLVRRDHGRVVGWIAAVQGKKAIAIIRRITPCLTEASKRCRALTILRIFGAVASVSGKHPSSEVFAACPPPTRLRGLQAQPAWSADGSGDSAESAETLASVGSRPQVPESKNPLQASAVERGWLCGLADGEGYVHIRYRSDRNTMYPRLRIFVKSRPIIDTAARLMGVNPYARRSHRRRLGWYVSVSHLKALRVLRLIAPHLLEPSKKCRARRILDTFGNVGSVHSRLGTVEFFAGCPPPARIRATKG